MAKSALAVVGAEILARWDASRGDLGASLRLTLSFPKVDFSAKH